MQLCNTHIKIVLKDMFEYTAQKRSVLGAVHLPGGDVDAHAHGVAGDAPGGAAGPVRAQQSVGAIQQLAVAAVAHPGLVSR